MLRAVVCALAISFVLSAQTEKKNFVAGLGGLAILSGDAQSTFARGAVASFHSPKDGLALNLAAGHHFNNWISAQGNYIFNRNDVTLNGVSGNTFYTALNQSRQHQIVFDGMLYVRPLSSRIRPYLSVGFAMVRVSRNQVSLEGAAAVVPTATAAAWHPGLRSAVGMDLTIKPGWAFRYSFSETLTGSLFSRSLVPPAQKNLMNFHHLFGVVWSH